MAALLSHLQPLGDVLEIGGNLESIQKYHPKSHTVLQDAWENELPKLGTFDTIVISGYPQDQIINEAVSPNELEEAQILIKEHKKVASKIEEALPDLSKIQYADEDLDQFCQSIGKTQPKQLVRFLNELHDNQQITLTQYENLVEKHQLSGRKSPQALLEFWKNPERLISFLKMCIRSHLRKNGSVACFLNVTLYENPQFFEEIITNSEVDYQEKPFQISDSKCLAMILKFE